MEISRTVVSYSDVDDSIPIIETSNNSIVILKKNKKRKPKNTKIAEEDYDEPDTFQTVVLPVAISLSNSTLGPQSGEEYLFLVKEERNLQASILSIDSSSSVPGTILNMASLAKMGFSFTSKS